METVKLPYAFEYHPLPEHFTKCLSCGKDCFPFPRPNTAECSFCFFLRHNPGWETPNV